MQREKVFSIITIICFASVIFIPIGLVLMFYFTHWSKKKKIILSIIMTILYITPVVIIMNLNPSYNTDGISIPGSYDKGATAFDSKKSKKSDKDNKEYVKGSGDKEAENPEDMKLPSTIKKVERKKNSSWLFPFLFFLTMLALIIIQNIRSSKKPKGYDNPYVDVTKYKLPLNDNSKLPLVYYSKLNTYNGESVLYATQTVKKDNEGDFIITNKRFIICNKEGTAAYKISQITLASSISDTVMILASGNEKNYIFLPENQMKYALGVARYAYNKFSGKKMS